MVEPWLGKYDTLRKVAGKLERGEISLEEGVEQIELGRRGTNQHTRNQDLTLSSPPSGNGGNGRAYTEARLRRDRPDLAARVGERLPNGKRFTANAAAIEAGFRKKPSNFERMLRWVPDLTDEEWERLVAARRVQIGRISSSSFISSSIF